MRAADAGPRNLIPDGVPLEHVPGLAAAQVASLHDLWILYAQQLVGLYGTNEPTRVRLAAHLQLPRAALDTVVNAAQRLLPLTRRPQSLDFEAETAGRDYPLGALLEDPEVVAARQAALPPYRQDFRAPLPACHTLLDQLPPLRSQGARSTCVAHAVLAVREQIEIAAGAPPDLDLSEQYVYWWCKARDGLPGRAGTYLSLGMRCVKETGAPLESLWPYTADPAADQNQGAPPSAAAAGDPGFSTAETQEFNRTDIVGMKTCLVEGRSIAFSLPVFDSWFKSSAMARWGLITLPLPAEPPRDGHAVAIVGYQDDARAPGGGYFFLRNSWQPWAWDGVWQAGYGYIPYAYVSRYASTIFSAYRPRAGRAYVRGESAEGQPWLTVSSPDVWLRQSPDAGEAPQPALAGQENALYVRLHNPGPTYLYCAGVEVYFKSSEAAIWERAGQFESPWLAPGETVIGPMAWLPPRSGHFAFAVRVV